MAKSKNTPKLVETLVHDGDKRTNIPTAEMESVAGRGVNAPVEVTYKRTSEGLEEEKAERIADLDPQLVWRGKDKAGESGLVVTAPAIYIQEKIHPKVLIDDLRRATARDEHHTQPQLSLFGDFNGIPEGVDKTEYYQHEQNWSNRMILGDSLNVMASLAEREGLRGQPLAIRSGVL